MVKNVQLQVDEQRPAAHDEKDDVLHTVVTSTDTEKGSIHTDHSTQGFGHGAEGEAYRRQKGVMERKLLLKLDLCILPFAVLLYLSAYLDRGNMANARLAGMQKTVLEDSDTNYSLALSCFFITYIVFSIPGTLLAKQFNPSHSIAAGALIWSLASTCQAATFNRAGMFTCRLFIGVGEALFGQAMAYHLSIWYAKRDLARRVGLFISAGAVAGAFGGLIGFGVTSIKHGKIEGWRILFLIEGCPSFLLAVCTALFMPSRPETSRLLSEDERTLCLTRLNAQSNKEATTGIDWRGVRRALTDWKTYVCAVMYSCMNLTLGSVGGFLPIIVKGFGYTNARAQLMSVPPYAVALVVMLLLTTISDRKQSRGLAALVPFALGIVGWTVLMAVPAKHATPAEYSGRYFACICIVTAGYCNIPIVISWVASNCGNESQRAASLGMLNTVGQCLSVLAAFLFPSAQGPQFRKGCIINLAFQAFGLAIALAMTAYFRHENKRRDRAEGGRPPKDAPLEVFEKFDLAPGFRYTV